MKNGFERTQRASRTLRSFTLDLCLLHTNPQSDVIVNKLRPFFQSLKEKPHVICPPEFDEADPTPTIGCIPRVDGRLPPCDHRGQSHLDVTPTSVLLKTTTNQTCFPRFDESRSCASPGRARDTEIEEATAEAEPTDSLRTAA